MVDQYERWLRVAAHLRVDRSRGPAPHKPLLLLVLAEIAEKGDLPERLWLTGELAFRFITFWNAVAARRSQRPAVYLPFYHLKSDGIWVPLDTEGNPTTDRKRVTSAAFDPEFLDCLRQAPFRDQLRRVLIARYFDDAGERASLYALVGLPVPSAEVMEADARAYDELQERGREARFRLTVVPAYNYTCALTRYRCVTTDSGSIVDAAHIHQFADSRNNQPQNGLALSKNAHWMFDAGLWSLDDDYRVVVAPSRFDEAGEGAFLLKRSAGQRIMLPENPELWPDRKHLAWHRLNRLSLSGGTTS